MRANHTLSLIRQRQPAVGLWMQLHSFHMSRILAAQGLFDWLMLDMEHTPVDLSTASMIFAAVADVSGGQCTPLVRVASGTIDRIKQGLDAGAQGVLVPMINTAEDARAAVRYARYPPEGERGGGGITPHLGFGLTNHAEYIAQANREILVAAQIETAEAVENIDAIAEVEGLDLLFVGPFDLHLSLGLPPALWSDHPRFLSAIEQIRQACQRRNLPMGTLAPNGDGAASRVQDGFSMVGMGADIQHLLGTLRAQREALSNKIHSLR